MDMMSQNKENIFKKPNKCPLKRIKINYFTGKIIKGQCPMKNKKIYKKRENKIYM